MGAHPRATGRIAFSALAGDVGLAMVLPWRDRGYLGASGRDICRKMKGFSVGLDLRDMRAADRPDFLALWQQYLAFYHMDLPDAVIQSTWVRLMDEGNPMTGRIAVLDGIRVGFAIHLHHASSWVAGDDCYLEDLFVTDAARGHGVGRALIDDVIRIARTKGWHRVYWHTGEGNTRARALYDQYTPNDGHIRYRLRL